MEAKHYLSKTLYTLMLFTCAGILITELLGALFLMRVIKADTVVLGANQFLFYLFLVCLCLLWTLYSYLWFNGNLPSRKTLIGFAAGTAAEVAMLVANLFSGSIYAFNAAGVYTRGDAFPLFIAFCYLFLVIAVAGTAFNAVRRQHEDHRQNLLLFLLFFLFPICGPVLQYFFPDYSLMGISEAIALLTVYVTIQQRTATSHAVEMAHFQDEVIQYERSLENLLAVRPDALSVFRFNLSRNTYRAEGGSSPLIEHLATEGAVDEFFDAVASLITDDSEAQHFRKVLNRSHLLQLFDEQTTHLSLRYHRATDNGESRLVKTYFSMLRNPRSNDIEAIAYSLDIDKEDKEERVISAIANCEYDYIALIDARSRMIHYQYSSQDAARTALFEIGDYDTVMKRALTAACDDAECESAFEHVSFETVSHALSGQDEYSVILSCRDESGRMLQKKHSYRYLDRKHTEILFLRNDVTEETRQERARSEELQTALLEARHANDMKTEFLSNASHDMRTPLNAIIGYTELARTSSDDNAIQDYLGKISQASSLLRSLINDTLDLSKIETGMITLKPAPVNHHELLAKIVAAVHPAMDKKHIDFVLDDDIEAEMVEADALRVQEVFINLLSNAIKFTPEGGTVTLNATTCVDDDADCVHDRITVADTGRGMSPDFVPKMFEPFAQELTPDTVIAGSGLGLSIVKRLVDMMSGTIEVESQLGKGTRITVCLDFPRADAGQARVASNAPVDRTLKGRRVLLVEDNAMNMEIAKMLLEQRDMIVTCAENGQVACRLFAESELGGFDAILMDIRMPVMNGLEAARAIRQMNRADSACVPIIALSADAFDDDVQESLDAGMNAHVAKPIDPAVLFAALGKALEG